METHSAPAGFQISVGIPLLQGPRTPDMENAEKTGKSAQFSSLTTLPKIGKNYQKITQNGILGAIWPGREFCDFPLGVTQTVFLVNRVFVPCQKGPFGQRRRK